jgi:hypothetical protein
MFPPDLASSRAFEVTPFGDMYKLRPGALGSLKERFSSTKEYFSRASADQVLIVADTRDEAGLGSVAARLRYRSV